MFDTSSRVAHMRPAEITLYFLGAMLSAAEEPSNVAYQFCLGPRSLPPHSVGFDILVEQLVRIQLWAVTWEKVNSYLSGMLYPANHFLRKMNGMSVDNQKHLAWVLPAETLQKVQKHTGRKSSLENHEGQFAPVGNRGEHIATEPFARTGNNRRMPSLAVKSARLVIRAHTGFVSPEDRRFLPMGQGADSGIFPFQPAAHRSGILFVSLPQRFLRSKAPASQIAAYSPDRQLDTKAFPDQFLYGLACPKHKRELELIGATVGN